MKAYRNMLGKVVSGLLLAGAFVVVTAARAEAGLIVYVCNDATCSGGDDFVIVDDGIGDANSAVEGQITAVIAGIGIELATSYPRVGDPSQPYLNLTYSIGDLSVFGGTPYLYALQDGFTYQGNVLVEADASDGSGQVAVYADLGAPIFSCLAMDCAGTGLAPAAPYFLMIQVQPTAGGLGSASGDVTITAVPDGGSTMMLLGSVLVGFGAFRRKFTGR